MKRSAIAAVAVLAAIMLAQAAPANAEPLPPYCERAPILGLNPYIRTICDQPILEDGSWMRARLSHYLGGYQSTCGGRYYEGGNCPPWASRDVTPDKYIEDDYQVTWDTIPPGEPGHLD